MRHVLGVARLPDGELRYFTFCVHGACPHLRLYGDPTEATAFARRDCADHRAGSPALNHADLVPVEVAVAYDGGRSWRGVGTRHRLGDVSPWRPTARLVRGTPAWAAGALVRAGAAHPRPA